MKHLLNMATFVLVTSTAAVAADHPSAPSRHEPVERVAGSCILFPKGAEGDFIPEYVAEIYFGYEREEIAALNPQVEILKAPRYGRLKFVSFSEHSSNPHFIYKPPKGFLGKDSAEFSVRVGSETLRVIGTVVFYQGVLTSARERRLCPRGGFWKISRSWTSQIASLLPHHVGDSA